MPDSTAELTRPFETPIDRLRPRVRRRRAFGLVWRMVTVSGIVLVSSAAVYPLLPRTYTATADVLLRPTNQEGRTTWDQSINDAMDDNAIQTKIDVFRSEPLQRAVIKTHGLLLDPEYNGALRKSALRAQLEQIPLLGGLLPLKVSSLQAVGSTLVRHLVVRRERKSYMIQVGYESADPEKAATMTNTLVHEFLADQIGRKNISHQELLKALGDRVSRLETEYRINEEREHAFIIATGLDHFGDKDSTIRQLDTLSGAVAEAHRKTVETGNIADNLVAQQKNLDYTTQAMASPLLQRLRERLVELSSGAGSGNVPSGVSGPVLATLRVGIDAETARLVRAAQGDAEVARRNEDRLRAEITRLDAKLAIWKANDRRREDLHRAVQTALDGLNGANQRYMTEAGRGDVMQADVEIVSMASVPDRPSFPSPLFYMVGTMALVVLMCGFILLPTMIQAAKQAGDRAAH